MSGNCIQKDDDSHLSDQVLFIALHRMKKCFVLIIAVVYLSSIVGATVHLHYCMDKLVNWSLNDEGNKCKKCGMEKDGGCCKDESKFVRNSLDQSTTSTIQFLQAPSTVIHISFISFAGNYSLSSVNEYPTGNAPPPDKGVGIFIRNCVFRI